MTYLHTHPWAIGNQHLLIVYIVLVYLRFIVLWNLSVNDGKQPGSVSLLDLLSIVERENDWTSVRGRCWWCITLKTWRDCSSCDGSYDYQRSPPQFWDATVQRKTRQRRQKEFGCTRACVSVRVHSCSFHVYLGPGKAFILPRLVPLCSCDWRGLWGHQVLSEWLGGGGS